MSYNAFLQIHVLLVSLYVIFFLIKFVLLLSANEYSLINFRRRTKLLEMLLPVLFLVTGIILALKSGNTKETWFIVKLVALMLAIVLGILTFKNNSVLLGIATIGVFVYIYILSYTKSPDLNSKNRMNYQHRPAGKSNISTGANIYIENGCQNCHAENGAGVLSEATNLQKSRISNEEIKTVIQTGHANIPDYHLANLPETALDSLVEYVKSLRK